MLKLIFCTFSLSPALLCSLTQTFASMLQLHMHCTGVYLFHISSPLLFSSLYCLSCSITPVGLFLISHYTSVCSCPLWELSSVSCLRESLHACGAAEPSSHGVGMFYEQWDMSWCGCTQLPSHLPLTLLMLLCFQHSEQWHWCTPPTLMLSSLRSTLLEIWILLEETSYLKLGKMSQSCEHRCMEDRDLVLH